MADEVDKQVVEIEFDNSKFDKNVKKSSSTLDEFKSKLKFEDAARSMDAVVKKLNLMEMAVYTTVSNITNRVVNLGIILVKSLSIDNIAAGWDKFNQKTTATATILAQNIKIAGRAIDDIAEKTEIVNEQLKKLLWFTDETSYNFTDMVESIGKFTAAGVDLDVASKAMQGIATWAAKSGQNATTASRAMYQLAQALGKGYVQLMDWHSIQTANMDTQEFRETALKTAVALGKLRQEGDAFISKTGKKINAKNFTDTLNEKWFTTDVLVKTLDKYSAAVEQIYKLSEETGLTAYEVIEQYGEELDKFGLEAFKAAQECRTLNDALNSIKDAVSTGWMQTFELVIGQYAEAKDIWSGLADSLYEAFVESNNFRNGILKTWRALEGNNDLFGEHGSDNQGAFWNIYDAIHELKSIVSGAWNTIFPKSIFEDTDDQIQDLARNFKMITSRIKEFTSSMVKTLKNNTSLQNTLTGMASILQVIMQVGVGILNAIMPALTTAKDIFGDLLDRLGVFGIKLANNEKVLETISNVSTFIANGLERFIKLLDPAGVISQFLDFISSIFNGTFNPGAAADAVVKYFSNIGSAFANLLDKLKASEHVNDILNSIADAFSNFFKKLKSIFKGNNDSNDEGALNQVVDNIVGRNGAAGANLAVARKMLAPINDTRNFIDEVSETTVGMGNSIKEFVSSTIWLSDLLDSYKSVGLAFAGILTSVGHLLTKVFDVVSYVIDILADFDFKGLLTWIKENWIGILGVLATAYIIIFVIIPFLKDMWYACNSLATALDSVTDGLWRMGKAMNKQGIASIIKSIGLVLLEISLAISIMSGIAIYSTDILETAVNNMLKIISVFGTVMTLIILAIRFIGAQKNDLELTIDKSGLKTKGSIFAPNSPIYALAGIFQAFGLAMMEIASAMAIIALIPEEDFKRSNSVLLALGAIGVVVSGLGVLIALINKNSKNLINVNSIYPGLWSMIGFAIALKSLSKVLQELTVFAKDGNNVWPAIGTISVILVALSGLMLTAGWATKLGGDGKNKNISKSIKSMAVMLMSFLPLAWAIKDLAEIAVDRDSLIAAVASLAIIPVVMMAMMAVVMRIQKDSKVNNIGGISKAVSSLALLNLSMLPLVWSIMMLADSLNKNGGSVVGAMFSLTLVIAAEMAMLGVVIKMAKGRMVAGIGKSIAGLLAMNIALLPFVMSTWLLSVIIENYNLGTVAASMGLLVVVMLAYAGVMAAIGSISGESSGMMKMIGAMLASTLALVALIAAVAIFQTFDTVSLIVSMAGISIVLLALMGVLVAISKVGDKEISTGKVVTLILGFVVIAGALAGASMLIANSPMGNIISFSASLIALLYSLVGVIALINKVEFDEKKIEKFALGMVVLIGAMTGLALVLAIMQGMDLKQAALSMLLLIVVITTLTAIVALFTGLKLDPQTLLTMAAGIALLSVAMLPLVFVMMMMEQIDLLHAAIGLAAICATLAVFVLLSKLLGPSASSLLTLASAFLTFSIACLVIAVSIDLVAIGLMGLMSIGDEMAVSMPEKLALIAEAINNSMGSILSIISSFLEIIATTILMAADKFLETVVQLLVKIAEALPQMKDPLISIINDLLDIVDACLPRFKTTLSLLISNIIAILRENTPAFIVWLAETITEILTQIKTNAKNWAEMLFDIVWDILSTFATKLISKLPDIINFMFDFVKKVLDSLGDTLVKRGKEMGVTFIRFGKNLMKGLWNGMMGGLGELVKGIPLIGGALEKFFKETLQIHSPSRMTAEMGVYLMQGFGVGMKEELNNTKKETTSVIADCMTSALSDAYDIINDEDEELVIRPVVDLSGVEYGANSISSMMSSINGTRVSLSSGLAASVVKQQPTVMSGKDSNNQNRSVINNSNESYNVTFNVQTNDPDELARQTDVALQRERRKAAMAKGGAY